MFHQYLRDLPMDGAVMRVFIFYEEWVYETTRDDLCARLTEVSDALTRVTARKRSFLHALKEAIQELRECDEERRIYKILSRVHVSLGVLYSHEFRSFFVVEMISDGRCTRVARAKFSEAGLVYWASIGPSVFINSDTRSDGYRLLHEQEAEDALRELNAPRCGTPQHDTDWRVKWD